MIFGEFENLLAIVDYAMETKRRRHIVGGILMSVSLLFGGLAFTVMTTKEEKNYD